MAYIVPAYIVLAYIAMNQALVENLFVVIICILNKIPIFVVGKPGSSKTLTMQVIGYGLHTAQLCRRVAQIVMAKPGSCKTLTTQVISQLWPLQLWPGLAARRRPRWQVIASNLQGKQSPRAFWHRFPAVHMFQYQCSPMSSAAALEHQFSIAVRYQEHAASAVTVLLLDEVGLAEFSPDMPLKVLHRMLIDPPVSVVGLSNWKLDSAKMNRAVVSTCV